MELKVLSNEQVEHFIEYGYVKLEAAYPRKQALAALEHVWEQAEKHGVKKDDPSTWTIPLLQIQESYNTPAFQECATERLFDAIGDLEGHGRGMTYETFKSDGWGWWPINFSAGADQPWNVPTRGWHWDGQHFRHFVNSREQGLLIICVFSDIGPHGGGTLVAEGTHNLVARLLQQFPDGVEQQEALRQFTTSHPWIADLTGRQSPNGQSEHIDPSRDETRVERLMENTFVDSDGTRLRVAETTASVGDVLLCHPFVYHSSSQNHSGVPRFICNRTAALKEPMNLNRSDGDYSPVELSIRRAIY